MVDLRNIEICFPKILIAFTNVRGMLRFRDVRFLLLTFTSWLLTGPRLWAFGGNEISSESRASEAVRHGNFRNYVFFEYFDNIDCKISVLS